MYGAVIFLGFPIVGCLFVIVSVVTTIFKDTTVDTTPFTTAGFAFLATITALTFNFLKSFEKDPNMKRYYETQRAGVLFFLSTFFFLFTSVMRFSMFNTPLIGTAKDPSSFVQFVKWNTIVSVSVSIITFIAGIIQLFPHLISLVFYDKERIKAWEQLYPNEEIKEPLS